MDDKQKTFEENLEILEEIVKALEEETLSLEKSVKLYEEGVIAAGQCTLELEEIERKLKLLCKSADGVICEESISEDDLG